MEQRLNLWNTDYSPLFDLPTGCKLDKIFADNCVKNEDKIEGKKKCEMCKKKTGLDYFFCEDKIYCSNHRYHHTHICNFDSKKNFQEKLREDNVKIIKEKLTRI